MSSSPQQPPPPSKPSKRGKGERPKPGELTKYGEPAKPAGKPKYQFDAEVLKEIERYASIGMTNKEIAWRISCDESTLQKYIALDGEVKKSLDRGRATLAYDVSETIVTKALKEKDNDLLKFVAARKLRWSETPTTVNVGNLTVTAENYSDIRKAAEQYRRDQNKDVIDVESDDDI